MKKLALALCASALVVMAAPTFAEDAANVANDASATATQAADVAKDATATETKATRKKHAHKKHHAKKKEVTSTEGNADAAAAAPESNDAAQQ